MLKLPMDLALYATILLMFASFASVHFVLCVSLAKKDWKRAVIGFIAFPLAPYFGQSLSIKRLPALWVTCAMLYAVSLLAGSV